MNSVSFDHSDDALEKLSFCDAFFDLSGIQVAFEALLDCRFRMQVLALVINLDWFLLNLWWIGLRFFDSFSFGSHLLGSMLLTAESPFPEVVACPAFSIKIELVRMLHLLCFKLRAADLHIFLGLNTLKSLERKYGPCRKR